MKLINSKNSLHVEYTGSANMETFYQGYVGQPNAKYNLNGNGIIYGTTYNGNIKSDEVETTYEINLDLLDERGICTEGLGGYVGVLPADQNDSNTTYEYSQPLLNVQAGSTLKIGGKTHTIVSGSIWNDMQYKLIRPENKLHIHRSNYYLNHIIKNINKIDIIPNDLKNILLSKNDIQSSLYFGCWLAINITEGDYKGISFVAVSLWDPEKVKDVKLLNSDIHSYDGFLNTFMDIDYTKNKSGLILTDRLRKIKGDTKPIPYKIEYKDTNQMYDQKLIKHPYADNIDVTIRNNSISHKVISEKCGEEDIIFKLQTFTPFAELMSTPNSDPIYECAGKVFLNNTNVGNCWIEQMFSDKPVKPPPI